MLPRSPHDHDHRLLRREGGRIVGYARKGVTRVDANHAEIVSALREAGVSVVDLSGVGQGCPDLLCGWCGHSFVLEVKRPLGPRTDAEGHDDEVDLTDAQIRFASSWRGSRIWIVRSVKDALDVFGKSAAIGKPAIGGGR